MPRPADRPKRPRSDDGPEDLIATTTPVPGVTDGASQVHIREAQATDASQIAEVRVRSWQQAYSGLLPQPGLDALTVADEQARQTKWLAQGGARVYVASDDHRVVGIATLGMAADADHGGPAGPLNGMYVHPDVWRQGVGRLLWQRVVAEATAGAWAWLHLTVLVANHQARSFYEAMGCRADPASTTEAQVLGAPVQVLRYWFALGAPAVVQPRQV